MKVVEAPSSKVVFQKILSRSEKGAQHARESFIEVTLQHAIAVSQHPEMIQYFGTNPTIGLPHAVGLNGGTGEYEFIVESIAVQKLREDNLYLQNKTLHDLADCCLTISDEDCLITGKRFGKIILRYRQGQKGAGTDENCTPCE